MDDHPPPAPYARRVAAVERLMLTADALARDAALARAYTAIALAKGDSLTGADVATARIAALYPDHLLSGALATAALRPDLSALSGDQAIADQLRAALKT